MTLGNLDFIKYTKWESLMTFGDLDLIKIDFEGSYILIKYSLILLDKNIASKQITDTYKRISEALWRHLFFLSGG